jgi:hypothetical protein
MLMKPGLRKFVLTAHIVFSVGWLGAVAAFLALAVAGLSSQNDQTARAAYVAMDLIGWFVIVPCSLITLLIGLVQSLGTKWGLFRHYWVLIKFLLTVGATVLLLLHMNATSRLANAAADVSANLELLRPVRVQLIFDAAAALLVLLAATILSVYKPWGLTRYGRRKQREQSGKSKSDYQPIGTPWDLYILIGLGVLVLAFVILHFAKGGMVQRGH